MVRRLCLLGYGQVRPDERHAGRNLGGGAHPITAAVPNAGAANGADTGRRLARQFPPTGTACDAGTAGDAGAAGTGCTTGDAGDVAGATDGTAATGGDVAVIPAVDRQPSGRQGPPGRLAPTTRADACEDKGLLPGVKYGAVS